MTGIPKTPLSFALWVKEDPARRGLLFARTEGAIYVSFDDGGNWQSLQTNLPHAPVHDITVQEQFGDLVIPTYGRGFWILDDITPLRQLTPEVQVKAVHPFAPRPAWRFRTAEAALAASYDPVTGENPKYGASLNFWLKASTGDSATITIQDASGKTVRTFRGPAEAGKPEFTAPNGLGRELKVAAVLRGFDRTRATAHGHALTAGEIVAVAHQFGGGVRSIPVVEQPAGVLCRGPQRGKLPRTKELFILGRRPTMSLSP